MIRCSAMLMAALALLTAACAEPPLRETKVIVGATLRDTNPPLSHSVVVIRDGKVSAIGPQQTTPIPKASQIINATGKYLVSANRGTPLRVGDSADLLLLSANETIERRMVSGKWIDR
jgi:hypothetical protein